jgi:hypothetical protein
MLWVATFGAHGHLVLSALTDVMLAIIPVAAFWKLQMKTKTKIGLFLLMGTTTLYESPSGWC